MPRVDTLFRVVDIGTIAGLDSPYLQNGPAIEAMGINERGEVAINTESRQLGRRAFCWSPNAGMRPLSVPEGREVGSQAQGINDLGHVVGWTFADEPYDRACLWRGSSRLALDADFPPPRGRTSKAYAINNRGQVVGECYPGGSFLWDRGKVRLLPELGAARAINEMGWVLGSAGLLRSGRITVFDDRADSLRVTALNDRGQMIVQRGARTALWDKNKVHVLEVLPGDAFSVGSHINNCGQVMGFSWRDKQAWDKAQKRFFLWQAGKVIDPWEHLAPGHQLSSFVPTAINDGGQIVGYGYVHKEIHVILLNPS